MKQKWIIIGSLLALSLSACTAPVATPDPLLLSMQATLNALSTQNAALQATISAPKPSGTPIPTPAEAMTITPPIAPTSAGGRNCSDVAYYVADATIPDGTLVPPGSTFTKTWLIKNGGTCTWTSDYSLVAVGGDLLGATSPSKLNLTTEVLPGDTVALSVNFTAPDEFKVYRSFWKLQNPEGGIFGTYGASGETSFYLEINVGNRYDFVANMCSATWKSAAGDLPCPGKLEDANGFAVQLTHFKTENGGAENEAAILVVPNQAKSGYISGQFPAVIIPANAHFISILGCVSGNEKCDVRIRITYSVEGGPEEVLYDGQESYDGELTRIDQRLDTLGLEGKAVAFIIQVAAGDSTDGDRIFWLAPRLEP